MGKGRHGHDSGHHNDQGESFKDGTLDFCDEPKTCCLACFTPFHLFAENLNNLKIMSYGAAFALYLLPWLGLVALYMVFIPTAAGMEVDQDGQVVRGSFLQEYKAFAEVFLTFGLVGFCVLICVGAYFRGQIREKMNISGSTCEDCCFHACCCCCAIAQEYREVRSYMDEISLDLEQAQKKPLLK